MFQVHFNAVICKYCNIFESLMYCNQSVPLSYQSTALPLCILFIFTCFNIITCHMAWDLNCVSKTNLPVPGSGMMLYLSAQAADSQLNLSMCAGVVIPGTSTSCAVTLLSHCSLCSLCIKETINKQGQCDCLFIGHEYLRQHPYLFTDVINVMAFLQLFFGSQYSILMHS